MATNNLSNYKNSDGFGMALNIRRGNPNPLDNSSVWASLSAAQTYAKDDPTAYVGQILTVVDSANSKATAYVIQDTTGTLVEVGEHLTIDSTLSSTSTNPIQNKTVEAALAAKADKEHSHDYIPNSAKGANNGVATLGSDGKVPSSQLPSYVDDVLEYANKNSFPSTGVSGIVYVDAATNKTYRWSGSAYVVIGTDLALGETSSTAFAGDKGKIAYEHSQVTSSNPHNVTKSDLGLSNVENKSSVTIRSELTKENITNALGYTPPESDTKYTHPTYTAKESGLYKVTVDSTGHISNASAVTKEDITALGIPAQDTVYTLPSAGTNLGGVKSGGDVTISDGIITVTDDSHNHIINNIDGLQDVLNNKASTDHGTHVEFTSTVPVMDGTVSAGTASTVARSDHRHPTDTSRAAASDLSNHIDDTTAHITATERTNWNTAKTHASSTHAPSNAEKNQNAFSNITVGSTTIEADTTTDTLILAAGNNVTITADTAKDKITVSATDTTYTAGTGLALDGTAFKNTAPLYVVPTATVVEAGSSTSKAYLATKWSVANVDGITTPVDGMTVMLRTPAAGTSGGILLSIDNGNTYHPLTRNATTLVTTVYAAGCSLILTYNATAVAKPYTSAGVTSEVTGVWQIADYDSDTKTRSSDNQNKKMFIIGATSQSTSGQTTYSNKQCYIGTDNKLYSEDKPVLTELPEHSHEYAPIEHTHDDRYYTETEVNNLLSGKADTHDHPYAPASHNHDDKYYTETEINNLLTGKSDNHEHPYAPAAHEHDDRYYTESEVNTLLAGKADTHEHPYASASHTHGNIKNDGSLETAGRVMVTDSNKKVTVSNITTTELDYLDGVTSNIQTQLDSKVASTSLKTVATSGKYTDLTDTPKLSINEIEATSAIARPVGEELQLKFGDSFPFISEISVNKDDSHKLDTYVGNYKLPNETALSKATVQGTGNAVTDIDVSGHIITLKKNSNFLTTDGAAAKVANKLTVGNKEYDGSTAITVEAKDLGLEQAMKFIGSTTTALTDGATTNPITVNSKSVTATAGNVVLSNGYEFVWTGNAWEQLGQEGSFSLKTHTHTVSHTPAGSVSQPTFTGTEAGHTHSFSGSASHDHSFTGTAASHKHNFTGTGTLIKATFNGTEQTASVGYTPEGTISTPTITVTPDTTTVNSITNVGTLPSASLSTGSASLSGSVSDGPNRTVTLSINYTAPVLTFEAGTLPTKGSNTTVVTGIKSASSSQPTFTGTAATISHKHTPSGTITVTTAAPGSGETANYTPSGSLDNTSITPAGTVGSKSLTVSGTTGETKLTPAGTVSKPTFTGTAATLTTAAANS